MTRRASTPPAGSRRHEYMQRPHGDWIVLTHGDGRLVKVAEVHPEAGEVRALFIKYGQAGGVERITRIEMPALGLKAEHSTDIFGGLAAPRAAVRTSCWLVNAGPRNLRHKYQTSDQPK